MKRRVTGLGGVFFRSKNPARLAEWYRRHLGIVITTAEGQIFSVFHWRHPLPSRNAGATVWAPFPTRTRYFGSQRQPFMINYIVEDLDRTLRDLRKERVGILGDIDESDLGRFAWIRDPEGHRVELWEPVSRPSRGRKP